MTVCKEYGPPRATLAAVLRDLYTMDTTKPVSGCTPPHLSLCSLSSSSLAAFLLGDAISSFSSNASSSWVQQRRPLRTRRCFQSSSCRSSILTNCSADVRGKPRGLKGKSGCPRIPSSRVSTDLTNNLCVSGGVGDRSCEKTRLSRGRGVDDVAGAGRRGSRGAGGDERQGEPLFFSVPAMTN